MSGYYVEVGYGDYEVDQELAYFALGWFRTEQAAEREAARVRRLLRKQIVFVEAADSQPHIDVKVRPFVDRLALVEMVRAFGDLYEPGDSDVGD